MNSSDGEIDKLRSQARWRSMLLPGAGYALLGDSRAAWRTILLTVAGLGAMIGLCFLPNISMFLFALVLTGVGLSSWVTEQRRIKSQQLVAGPKHFLDRSFGLSVLTIYMLAGWVLALAITSFGALVVSPDSAIADLPSGTKVLFNRRLMFSQLRPGTLVAFQGPADDANRDLDVGRILAGPGDRIGIDRSSDEYIVNDKPAGKVAESIDAHATLNIPSKDEPLIVPSEMYIVVLDPTSPSGQRHITQLRKPAIVSHRLWRISPGLPARLE